MTDEAGSKSSQMDRLLAIMARLRDPDGGCPWDLEQSFKSIAPYTIEEAYEVADAIERGSLPALKEELGDLLFQVVFHARMAEEDGAFAFADVVDAVCAKMIERHPHVFGDAAIATADDQTRSWEDIKAKKRAAAGASSVLDDVPLALPALLRAEKLTKRAARIGFDWPTADEVLEKLDEEMAELHAARESGDQAAIIDEFGDVMFTLANLARKLKIDPEESLRQANAKFEKRFRRLEAMREADRDYSLDELEALWREAKKRV